MAVLEFELKIKKPSDRASPQLVYTVDGIRTNIVLKCEKAEKCCSIWYGFGEAPSGVEISINYACLTETDGSASLTLWQGQDGEAWPENKAVHGTVFDAGLHYLVR